MSTDKLARKIYRKVADARQAYQRKRLVLPASGNAEGDPTVYFLTPDHAAPAGGIRVIYRHVDILNAAGVPAAVLHQRAGFRCKWFENETKVLTVTSTRVRPGDIIVMSELDIDLVPRLPGATNYVIFNQNSHLTWTRLNAKAAGPIYAAGSRLRGIVTVSRHNQDMLRSAFPGRPIERVHLGIDPDLFHAGAGQRQRRIAYMPRRGHDDARQVLALLRGQGALDGWDVVALDNLTHAQVAQHLRTTRIFLAFTHQEGFGLPAAEAMACGNYVIGNHGFGGREFFRSDFSVSIESGDTVGFAHAVKVAINRDRDAPDWCAERGREASRFILQEYSPGREREEVVQLFSRFLAASHPMLEAAE